MANKQVGDSPVKRRTECFNDEDWGTFNSLVGKYDLNGVSSLHRLFLRLWEKYGNRKLSDISGELVASGYEPTISGLMQSVREENDRIQPVSKEEALSKKGINNVIKNVFKDNK